MSAGVIAANMSWNAANRTNGIVDRVDRARREADVDEADEVEVADQAHAVDVRPEREAEADEDPDDADDGQPEEAVHDRREDVLAADEPAVEEGEAGQHDHDERGRHEQPGGIAAVRDRVALGA